MNKTNIEYCDYSWNPIAMRCTPVSEGCENCWHLVMAKRMAANPRIPSEQRAAYLGLEAPLLCRWTDPMKVKTPALVATQFMGDLFHPAVEPADIALVWHMMEKLADRHTYLVLTKRPERLVRSTEAWFYQRESRVPRNIWLGITVENQETYVARWQALHPQQISNRWLSLEPLLGPMDIHNSLRNASGFVTDAIMWVVVGCESGPRRRPMRLEWAEDIVRQCQEARVPVFVKQVEINGRLSHNPLEWPEPLRVQQLPWSSGVAAVYQDGEEQPCGRT